jgi:23S rRNA pseudouridine1911/1915/1917 synthase
LDKLLVLGLPQISRNQIQKLIKGGHVSIDGLVIKKPALQLEGGEIVAVNLPDIAESSILPEAIPLRVIYEDEHLIVIDKSSGMVVHPSAGHATGTVVNALLAHAPDIQGVGGEKRPGVVHRLDKETSGVLILAKDDETHRFLQNQFSNRTVSKTYLALVDGRPKTDTGRIEAAIGRSRHERKKMAVVQEGKGRESVSVYKTLEAFGEHTFLEVQPITGRTHQIRVHLAYIGSPIVGDRVYGRKKQNLSLDRHFLHASSLRISIPEQSQPRTFHAPLPEELDNVLASLRLSSSGM